MEQWWSNGGAMVEQWWFITTIYSSTTAPQQPHNSPTTAPQIMIQNSSKNQGNQPSTRALQQGVAPRVDQKGNPVAGPRLAQKQRPQAESTGSSVAQAGKSALTKWILGGIVAGSLGATSYWIFT